MLKLTPGFIPDIEPYDTAIATYLIHDEPVPYSYTATT